MLFGGIEIQFLDLNRYEYFQVIIQDFLIIFVSDKIKEFLSKCWSENPEERPAFHETFFSLSKDLTDFKETVEEDEI